MSELARPVGPRRLVAMINAANRMGVILHSQGGSYEPGMFAALELD